MAKTMKKTVAAASPTNGTLANGGELANTGNGDQHQPIGYRRPTRGTARLKRTMLFLPEALLSNLGVYAMRKGKSKGEALRNILSERLEKEGLEPDRIPKSLSVAVQY